MAPNILITGFEAFGGYKVNPSIEAARKLPSTISSFKLNVEEIPLRYEVIKETIVNLIEKYQPSFLLMTGQAPRASISFEKVAINYAHVQKTAYNCGAKPQHETLEKHGPMAYFSTLPIVELKNALLEAKIPTNISLSAGAFGCNQIFYHLMQFINNNEINIPAGFIHVPSLPEQVIGKNSPSMTLELIIHALEIVITTTIKHLHEENRE